MQLLHCYTRVCLAFLLSDEQVDYLSRSGLCQCSEDQTSQVASCSLVASTSGSQERLQQGQSDHQGE